MWMDGWDGLGASVNVNGWVVISAPAHLNVYTAITEQHTKGEPAALGYDNWME